jgi:hypothetical protein
MSASINYSNLTPTLLLDFANTAQLDPRITFSRASVGSYYNASGILQIAASGRPRFDFNPVTRESLGLLIEEQRTNLLTYSEDFSNAAWVKDSATITTNQVAAPDGTLTADLLVASVRMYWFDNTGITGAKVQSIFAKQGTGTSITIAAVGGQSVTGGNNVTVNLTTGAVTSGHVAPNVTVSAVGNGFWRIAILASVTVASGNSTYWQILSTAGIYIWGAQLEAGVFATSYIPTVASQVTRAADAVSMTGTNFSSWFNNEEGTFYIDSVFNSLGPAGYPRLVAAVGSNPNFNEISIYTYTSGVGAGNGVTIGTVTVNETETAGINPGGQTIVNSTRAAVAYQVNNVGFSCLGLIGGTDTSATLPVCQELRIYGQARYQNQPTGTIKKIAYYPERLTNNQLQAMTR